MGNIFRRSPKAEPPPPYSYSNQLTVCDIILNEVRDINDWVKANLRQKPKEHFVDNYKSLGEQMYSRLIKLCNVVNENSNTKINMEGIFKCKEFFENNLYEHYSDMYYDWIGEYTTALEVIKNDSGSDDFKHVRSSLDRVTISLITFLEIKE